MSNKMKIFGGPVEIGYYLNGNLCVTEVKPHNLTMYAADDIVGRLVGGYPEYKLNTAYFEFTNDTVPTITPTPDNGQPYYAGLVAPQDFVMTSVVSQAFLQGSTENHESNTVTLFTATEGSTGYHGVPFNTSSKVYGAALAASPTGSFEDQIVFARIYFDTPLDKLVGSEIGFKWTIQFTH